MSNTLIDQNRLFVMGEELSEMGFALHWLKPCSKQPIAKGWSTAEVLPWGELMQSYQPGLNLGCRTGKYSAFGDDTALIVLDVDLKGGDAYKQVAFNALKQILNSDLGMFPYVKSPRGYHVYCRTPLAQLPRSMKLAHSSEQCDVIMNGETQRRNAWELELLSTGKQVVAPPSVHPDTKTPYELGNRWFTNETEIPILTDATLSRLAQREGTPLENMAKLPDIRTMTLGNYELEAFNLPSHVVRLIQDGVEKGKRSETLFCPVAVEMVKAGMSDQAICSILTDKRYGISGKPLEERRGNRESAAEWVLKYCIQRARQQQEKPIPLMGNVVPSASPPLGELGELGEIIKDVAAGIQVPQVMALNAALSILSLLTQGMANVQLESSAKPLSLYCITIARSGDRKTTVDKFFMRPVWGQQKELLEGYNEELAKYQAECDAIKREKKILLSPKGATLPAEKKDGSTGWMSKELVGKRLLQLEKETPTIPRYPLMITEEPTYEGLAKQLDVGLPTMGVMSSEGGRFLGGHAMNKDNNLKTIAGFSSLWDGEPITRLRASEIGTGATGNKLIFNRRLSLHLMLQPVIMEVVNEALLTGQGFLSRVLMVYPDSLAGTRTYQDCREALGQAANRWEAFIAPMLKRELDFNQKTGAINFDSLIISDEAQALWIPFYNEVEREIGKKGRYSTITEFGAKAGELARRLAGVLTLTHDATATSIPQNWMQAAISLMNYYLEERLRIVQMRPIDAMLKEAQGVLAKLLQLNKEKGWTLFCLEDVYMKANKMTAGRAREIFQRLVEHHYLFKLPKGAKRDGEYKKEWWQINPHALIEGKKGNCD